MEKSTIKFILSLLLYVTMISIAKAQQTKSGYLVTRGNMLIGTVQIDMIKNQASLETEEKMEFFSAKETQKAAIIDPKTGELCVYYTGTFGMNSSPFFFEALTDGDLPLLYREGVKFNKYEETPFPPYFILKEGVVYSLGFSKNEVLEVFSNEYQDEMAGFIKSNKLKLNKKEDLISLFEHYETVFQVAAN